ncbi:MAG: hypothetical protein WDM90_02855, partial [Ferruginibacter sp.]
MEIQLLLEKEGNKLWGTINYDNNLIVAYGTTLKVLEKNLRNVLKNFHQVEEVEFSFTKSSPPSPQ